MHSTLGSNWWALALRGVLAIAFGVFAFLWPGLPWLFVLALFAAYAFLDGVFAIVLAIKGQARGRWWWALLIEGVLGIAVGITTLFYPGLTQLALLYFIAALAISTGVLKIVSAIRLRKEIEGEWALALSGIFSVLFGAALLIVPIAGAIAVAWLIGSYAIAFGILLLALAVRLRPRRYTQPGTTEGFTRPA